VWPGHSRVAPAEVAEAAGAGLKEVGTAADFANDVDAITMIVPPRS
jgi:hypothetical protein